MSDDYMVWIAGFVVGVGVFLIFVLLTFRRGSVEDRLTDVTSKTPRTSRLRSALSFLPGLGTLLMPKEEAHRKRIESSLVQAGFYQRNASAVFFGAKMLMMVSPFFVGLLLSAVGLLTLTQGLIVATFVGLFGTVAPGLWIGRLKAARQKKMRRALPDTLDVIVICLEGGLSLSASFARVNDELAAAYPMLAQELSIVRRELELGRPTGEVFQAFADRFDTEELRTMAVLIGQSEKFGASLVRTFRIQADGLRLKRFQYAEEMAQKAPLKIIFPTVLCIFPALYIVLMGPAAVQIISILENLGR